MIIYSSASAMYAAANVEKINACTEPAKIPNNIIGNGITNGNVAFISNNPPGPLTSELEIKIEKLII